MARLDGRADRAQDRADLAAQEEEGDDGHDGDEGKDECVLGKALAFLVTTKPRDERDELCHRFLNLPAPDARVPAPGFAPAANRPGTMPQRSLVPPDRAMRRSSRSD